MYGFEPTEEQQLIVDTAKEFAQKDMRPHAHEAEERGQLPEAFLGQSWELGLACAAIPEAYDGAGMARSAVTGVLLAEELGWGDTAMALAMLGPATVAYPIVDYGTDAQRAAYLKLFTSRAFPRMSAALVEPDMDFDAASLTTSARRDGDDYILNGRKCFVPNGSSAETYLVYAREHGEGFDGVQAFLVSRASTGLSVSDKEKNMGIKALDSVELTLHDVRVPATAKVGGDTGIEFERIMSYSRVALCGLALGLARGAMEHAIEYAKERTTFGAPIATRQSVAFNLADMAMEIDAARMLTWEAAWQLDQGATATQETYLAKLYTDQMVLKVTDEAVMIMGGHGFIRENPVEHWLRNGRGFVAFDGLALV